MHIVKLNSKRLSNTMLASPTRGVPFKASLRDGGMIYLHPWHSRGCPTSSSRRASLSRQVRWWCDKKTLQMPKPFRHVRAEADVDQTAAADNGSTERMDPSTDKSIMSMADSLIERAQEVVNSGTVDDAFKECFVNELKTELTTLQEAVKSAEASASALEETLKSTKDQYVRLTADFENFRKRTATERDSLKASVKGDTLTAMLPLIDNFELAKSQLKLETDGERKIDAAYQGLYKQMVELFRGLGLEAVAGAGQPFDPEVHEAILREPSNDVPDGTVLEEFRKGFKLGERLLRPAMVKVSFTEGEASQSQSQSESESQSEDDGQ